MPVGPRHVVNLCRVKHVTKLSWKRPPCRIFTMAAIRAKTMKVADNLAGIMCILCEMVFWVTIPNLNAFEEVWFMAAILFSRWWTTCLESCAFCTKWVSEQPFQIWTRLKKFVFFFIIFHLKLFITVQNRMSICESLEEVVCNGRHHSGGVILVASHRWRHVSKRRHLDGKQRYLRNCKGALSVLCLLQNYLRIALL